MKNSEEHQHGKIRWPSMSGHRIFPYRFLHGGRLKKSNCLPTNTVFKTNIPLEGNMSFCRGMISHEGGRGNRNTTQILSSYSTYAAPFHMALMQHNFIRRFCSTQTLMWIIASIEFLTGKGQDFGQTWTLGHLDHRVKGILQ